jgi:hypothetical protein
MGHSEGNVRCAAGIGARVERESFGIQTGIE